MHTYKLILLLPIDPDELDLSEGEPTVCIFYSDMTTNEGAINQALSQYPGATVRHITNLQNLENQKGE